MRNTWIYDPAIDFWTSVPSLPLVRHGVPTVVVHNALYHVGGSDVADAIKNEGHVLIWSPSRNQVE